MAREGRAPAARPPRREEIDGVVCLWTFDAAREAGPGVSRLRGPWWLADVYAVNDDGRRLANPSGHGVEDWHHWLRDPEADGEEGEEHMGRAATLWTWEHGVRLLAMHPPSWPAEGERFLAAGFYEELAKRPDWAYLLEGGYVLLHETAGAARHLVREAEAHLCLGAQGPTGPGAKP